MISMIAMCIFLILTLAPKICFDLINPRIFFRSFNGFEATGIFSFFFFFFFHDVIQLEEYPNFVCTKRNSTWNILAATAELPQVYLPNDLMPAGRRCFSVASRKTLIACKAGSTDLITRSQPIGRPAAFGIWWRDVIVTEKNGDARADGGRWYLLPSTVDTLLSLSERMSYYRTSRGPRK